MAAGAKRRQQHLSPAMCWGDPVTPHSLRGICPPQRRGTGGICIPSSYQHDGMGLWVLGFGSGSACQAGTHTCGDTTDPSRRGFAPCPAPVRLGLLPEKP